MLTPGPSRPMGCRTTRSAPSPIPRTPTPSPNRPSRSTSPSSPPWREDGTPTQVVIDAVRGATIEAVRRIGKLLLVDTDRSVIGIRFGMTGRLLVDGVGPIDALEYGPNRDDRRWDRLVLRFADGRLLTVNDARRFGAKRHFRLKSRWATGGMIVNATMIDAMRAKDLVKARGRKSRPASPFMVKTGRKLTTVVATDVVTAEATSVIAS